MITRFLNREWPTITLLGVGAILLTYLFSMMIVAVIKRETKYWLIAFLPPIAIIPILTIVLIYLLYSNERDYAHIRNSIGEHRDSVLEDGIIDQRK